MEEKENKRISLIVDDDSEKSEKEKTSREKLKKPIIFGLMAIVFIACLYLIFKPKNGVEENKDKGLKNAVPEATDKGLQADKQKAYEKEMVEEREAAKRNSLMSLSDYWDRSDTSVNGEAAVSKVIADNSGGYGKSGAQNSSLSSYQNAQQTLGSFYRDDDSEKLALRKQVDELKDRLSEKNVPQAPTYKDQLVLMEKSYEMASRYLPSASTGHGAPAVNIGQNMDSIWIKKVSLPSTREKTESLKGVKKSVVSALYREEDASEILNGIAERNMGFITPGQVAQSDIVRNSIRAMVMETKTLSGDGSLKLRLSENATIGGFHVPKGTELVADTKFQGNRLQLKISAVEVSGNIIPVEILVYGTDGQLGLLVPRTDEINAAGEIAANMSQSSGMNISMSRSAGQQVASDLSRGLIQGVSGFFSKKLRAVKVTVRSGHPVLLLTKK
ncbi:MULTISPECIES: conjugative transposon protein TraM [Bacteroidota]|uniref:Bacteroides conjugative transposon TraM protein n=2 Tax=Bacteroidota TaxID=976 RepID=A0A2X2JLJ9_SPHMU|nr:MULTISPECIES: conjugative transposon protein TraM [Bacteroidota]AZB25135.1 conjugative transposon protein TraM [Chryseobacterium bernardetii]QRQ63223.1 conjugative transposon protein TraM [Sphingobacterium multivorum]SPZ95062.1 Bacteroides conjugative transposon TraM protein [Sphingobacterium multivorum]